MPRNYTVKDKQWAALRQDVYRLKGKYKNVRAETVFGWLKPKYKDYLTHTSQIEALFISYQNRWRKR